MLEKTRSNKWTLHLERKMVSFVLVLSSWGISFHSLGQVFKKALSPAQLNFTLYVDSSIVPESKVVSLSLHAGALGDL